MDYKEFCGIKFYEFRMIKTLDTNGKESRIVMTKFKYMGKDGFESHIRWSSSLLQEMATRKSSVRFEDSFIYGDKKGLKKLFTLAWETAVEAGIKMTCHGRLSGKETVMTKEALLAMSERYLMRHALTIENYLVLRLHLFALVQKKDGLMERIAVFQPKQPYLWERLLGEDEIIELEFLDDSNKDAEIQHAAHFEQVQEEDTDEGYVIVTIDKERIYYISGIRNIKGGMDKRLVFTPDIGMATCFANEDEAIGNMLPFGNTGLYETFEIMKYRNKESIFYINPPSVVKI